MTKKLPLVLLGSFFLVNGMNGYTDLIRWQEPFILAFTILVLGVIAYAGSTMIFRKAGKRVAFSFALLFFFLFARVIFTALKEGPAPHVRPVHFFLVSFVVLFLIFLLLRRSSEAGLQRSGRFLTLTLSVLIAYELIGIIFLKPSQPFTVQAPLHLQEWKGPSRPNIYVFLFDEYQGNKGLAELTGSGNGATVDMLHNHGFAVASDPRSTYRSTIYSLPSLFLMDTLAFTTKDAGLTGRSAIMADQLLSKGNTFTAYLRASGYRTTCQSIFAMDGKGPAVDYPIGTSWLQLLQLRMLPGWVKYDLLHVLPSNTWQKKLGTLNARAIAYNKDVLGKTLDSIGPSPTPRFMFSHFLLPHPPVMLTADGKERSIRDAMYEYNLGKPGFSEAYTGAVTYTNKLMHELVNRVNSRDPNSVVIILSDHGCRGLAGLTPNVFNIQWAMKVPGKDPLAGIADVHLVNTFRILLNNIAGQQLPMVDAQPKY